MSEDCLLRYDFDRRDLPLVRVALTESVAGAGVEDPVRSMFLQAALELVSNAVVHGGGSGRLTVRVMDDELRGEVTDNGPGLPDAPLLLSRSAARGHGLLLAETLTGRLEVRPGPKARGTTAAIAVPLDRFPFR